MAIATLTRIGNVDPARLEEDRELVIASSDKTRAMDGCEACISLTSPDGTEAIALIIWRDQASYDAYAKVRHEMIANLERDSKAVRGATIDQPQLYEVMYWK